jgi:branched-chain amino acid transport system permease protein
MDYLLHILIYIGIYTILSVSLNLLVGYTGLLSIAHAAFYGVGAYAAALLALKVQSPFLLNLVLAIIGAGVIGALLAIPSLRIKDDYFAIATFAFQVIIFSVLNNWVSFTGGPMGLPGIPQPKIFGFTVSSNLEFLVLVGLLCALTFWVCHRLVNSPFGRVLKAIREDEVVAQAFGKNIAAFKVRVFMISSALAAISGVLYATYISFIDPNSFTIMESIFIISIVIIGGAGSLWGAVVGAAVLTILPQLLTFIGLPNTVAANLRQILYGSLMVVFMLWRPQGFIGEYSFKKESKVK